MFTDDKNPTIGGLNITRLNSENEGRVNSKFINNEGVKIKNR